MPRPKNPFYSIASLRGLETLYALMHNISLRLPRGQYIDEIQKALHKDNVGVGGKSRNFVLKFLGEPDTEIDKVSGIDLDIIDEIVKKVYKWSDLHQHFGIDIDNVESPASSFEEEIFGAPAHLAAMDNDFYYYTYLSEDDQKSVDEFVKRRMYELGKITDGITTYSVYQWDTEAKTARCAILALNPEKKAAWYYYFASGAKGVRPTVLKTGRYDHGANILSLDMVNENARRKFLRVNFMLAVLDPSLSGAKTLKGALMATANNGTMVVSAECVLEHCTSYFEALKRVTNTKSRESLLCLEVLNKKYEVDNANIYDIQRLDSYPLSRVLDGISGYYLIEYIMQDGTNEGADTSLQKGLCYIGMDGLVSLWFAAVKDELKGYLDQQKYRGNKFIVINLFQSRQSDHIEVNYKLEIFRDHSKLGTVEYLHGVYTSFYLDTMYKGEIVFMKLDGGGCLSEKKFIDIEECRKKVGSLDPIKITDGVSLNDIDTRAKKLLDVKKYDHYGRNNPT
ncbi:MAG: hypothetical protein JWO03_3949 [Bacteroidetes bacterium]|nr:hypothetical protein [Bacteroidota bacterium]